MNPWEMWNSALARLPFGGDLSQSIAPLTNWFSPNVEVNFAGNRRIEGDIVTNVASYGKQLGLLTEAVVALSGNNNSPAVKKLRDLAKEIETRKMQHKDDVLRQARKSLETLQKLDPTGLAHALKEFAAPPTAKSK